MADLVLIDGDPLLNIKDLANVVSVMKNGRLFTVDELLAPFLSGSLAREPGGQSAPTHRFVAAVPESKTEYWWHDAKHYFADD